MKLKDVIADLREHELHAAVYDELISFLAKARDDELEIPTATEDGVVPLEVVDLVGQELESRRDYYRSMIDEAGNMEVVSSTAAEAGAKA
jgi:hypothetical protein